MPSFSHISIQDRSKFTCSFNNISQACIWRSWYELKAKHLKFEISFISIPKLINNFSNNTRAEKKIEPRERLNN